jgi:hypothetical protein
MSACAAKQQEIVKQNSIENQTIQIRKADRCDNQADQSEWSDRNKRNAVSPGAREKKNKQRLSRRSIVESTNLDKRSIKQNRG